MVKRPGSASDPLWYKDAIIYELHVRAFHDSNNDGIGDFPGLIAEAGLSPGSRRHLHLAPAVLPVSAAGRRLRHRRLSRRPPELRHAGGFPGRSSHAAHERGLQVMIELVVNHTSDQHPWFQAARHAPPGSPERDFYVWSDTDQKYKDARIIFTDTEKSNWTWDPVAKAYYWHRFFSHQPDLNYDNPAWSMEEVLKVMRFWLDMGVDGAATGRDSVPGRARRDQLREPARDAHADQGDPRARSTPSYANRMILAEANQWPRRRAPVFRRRRRMPHGVPLSADAADLSWRCGRRTGSRSRHHGADAAHSRQLPVGRSFCAITTSSRWRW